MTERLLESFASSSIRNTIKAKRLSMAEKLKKPMRARWKCEDKKVEGVTDPSIEPCAALMLAKNGEFLRFIYLQRDFPHI